MTEWRTVHLTQARQVAALMGLPEAGLPAPEVPVRAYYDGLRAGDAEAAVDFIAHALPRLEAVHWAAALLLKDRVQSGDPVEHPAPDLDALLQDIRNWLGSPDDSGRRKVHALAQRLDRTLPERTLAAAVFYSGGSIAPWDAAPVLPAPGLANRLAATAVLQAAYRSGDTQAFIARALREAEAVAEQDIDRYVSP